MTGRGAFDGVLDGLGAAIVSGRVPAGHVESVEAIVARTGVSRSIVREAVRVLVAAGLLSAGRRVGLRVLPDTSWDALNADVIRWRLDAPSRAAQLTELIEVRLAFEPPAAAAAALRRTDAEAARLSELADAIAAAASPDAFFAADVGFHSLLLACSRNAMFARLQTVVAEALRERSLGGHPRYPADPRDVELHGLIAAAVGAERPQEASARTRELVERNSNRPALPR
ncbi:MAG TPA: FCD domain-containing protein [Gryllotalpicola sp.]